MKKIANLLLCMMLLLSMAEGASAEDDGTATTEGESTQTEHQHTWVEGEIIPATCEQTGLKNFTCSGCSETKTEDISMTDHTYGDWSKNGSGHSRECSVCHIVDSGEHTGEWQQKDAAKHNRTCGVCGYQEEAEHSWKTETAKEATCTEDGSKQTKCTFCGYVGKTEQIAKRPHTYDSACDPDCNVCGGERAISHTYTSNWSSDYKGHWHECTKCGDRKDEAKHSPGPVATEDQAQLCLTCGYIIMPKKQHVHSYGTEWTTDDLGHWHACSTCKEEKEYAAHSYDDSCDGDCNVCGYKRENAHTYGDNWQTTAFEHWNTCSVCGKESDHEKHIPGEEATDQTPQSCTICGYELAPALEHTHKFGPQWFLDGNNHWQECECGEQSVPVPHVWDKGEEIRKGVMLYTCVDCGLEKTGKASSGFPWMIVILSVLALVCLGGIGVLVYLLKKGAFDEDDEDDEDDNSEETDEEDKDKEDEEEKMIDDYFSSLDQELYK